MLYYPILGVINLFVNTLKTPNDPSAMSDVALMEIIAGNFARLEYASGGQLTITFARELADFARGLLSARRERLSNSITCCSAPEPTHSLADYNSVMPFSEVCVIVLPVLGTVFICEL